MKDKVHVLFVCGYGVGSSAISESIVKKALVALPYLPLRECACSKQS